MRGHVILAHAQNLTNHIGGNMHRHFEHGPFTMFNYVKLHVTGAYISANQFTDEVTVGWYNV